MKNIWRTTTRFVRAFRADAGRHPSRHRGHAIARTIKDGTTLCSGKGSLGNAAQQRREDLMVEAAERYDASFRSR